MRATLAAVGRQCNRPSLVSPRVVSRARLAPSSFRRGTMRAPLHGGITPREASRGGQASASANRRRAATDAASLLGRTTADARRHGRHGRRVRRDATDMVDERAQWRRGMTSPRIVEIEPEERDRVRVEHGHAVAAREIALQLAFGEHRQLPSRVCEAEQERGIVREQAARHATEEVAPFGAGSCRPTCSGRWPGVDAAGNRRHLPVRPTCMQYADRRVATPSRGAVSCHFVAWRATARRIRLRPLSVR